MDLLEADRRVAERLVGATGRSRETARIVRYLGALVAVMFVIVAYLLALALIQGSARWVEIALPFVGEAVVIFASRALLDRGRVTGATLTFVWGSVAAIIPFVVLFPVAYPASVLAVAQVEAIGLAYLRGRTLIVTLIGMTLAAGIVTALGTTLGSSGGVVEKATITVIVLLSFGLLSLILGLNQARLSRAVREAEAGRDTLEERVQERTAALLRTTEELKEAGLLAGKATRAKSEFLANMSHELRTPLNAVLGFSELLTEQLHAAITDDQRRYLHNIHGAGQHLLELINEVLDLSKVEAGRIEMRPETIRLGTLLEPVVATARAAADAADVKFDPAIPYAMSVHVDPGRFRQIMYNLLSNAIKFTGAGGTVTLRVDVRDSALQLEVADTGIGIPREKHDRVFGVFERLHEGRSDIPGTGLGLALTKQLVELHHGSIGFVSEEGVGTTFRVTLPGVGVEPVRGDRLLIVEDVKADADLIAALASEHGLRSEVVGSAAAALDAVRSDPPRGVVLDLRLPDERGEHVLAAMKADPRMRAIPVIVVTVEDDEGRSRPLGADDHLTKPLDRQRLGVWLARLRVGSP